MNKEVIYTDIRDLVSKNKLKVQTKEVEQTEKNGVMENEQIDVCLKEEAEDLKAKINDMHQRLLSGEKVSSDIFAKYIEKEASFTRGLNMMFGVGACVIAAMLFINVFDIETMMSKEALTFFGAVLNSALIVLMIMFTRTLVKAKQSEDEKQNLIENNGYVVSFIFENFNSSNFVNETNIDKKDYDEKLLMASIKKFKTNRLTRDNLSDLAMNKEKLMINYKKNNIIEF